MGRSELLHMKGERVCRGNSVQSLSVSGRAGDSGPHPFSDCRFGLPYYWILTAEEVSSTPIPQFLFLGIRLIRDALSSQPFGLSFNISSAFLL